jgi:hypothetical protein
MRQERFGPSPLKHALLARWTLCPPGAVRGDYDGADVRPRTIWAQGFSRLTSRADGRFIPSALRTPQIELLINKLGLNVEGSGETKDNMDDARTAMTARSDYGGQPENICSL